MKNATEIRRTIFSNTASALSLALLGVLFFAAIPPAVAQDANTAVFDDFEDDSNPYFTYRDEEPPTTDTASVSISESSDVPAENGGESALVVTFDSDANGQFVGGFGTFGEEQEAATADFSSERYLNFYYKFDGRDTTSLALFVEFLEDSETGDGDQFGTTVAITDSSEYQLFSLATSEFTDSNEGEGDGEFTGNVTQMFFNIIDVTPMDDEDPREGGDLYLDYFSFTEGAALAVDDFSSRPDAAYTFGTAYPNPFREQATAQFSVRQTQQVTVSLHDVLGRRVRTLYRGTSRAGQVHSVSIKAEGLPSGTYFMRLEGEAFSATRSVILAR